MQGEWSERKLNSSWLHENWCQGRAERTINNLPGEMIVADIIRPGLPSKSTKRYESIGKQHPEVPAILKLPPLV